VDIPDAPPALAQLPPAVEPEEEFTIEDEETPLGNLPKTGTSGVSGIGMMGMGLSGLIGLMGTRKKGKHEDE
jgi:LPXTG-motif cell wall-anchored protein